VCESFAGMTSNIALNDLKFSKNMQKIGFPITRIMSRQYNSELGWTLIIV